MAHFIAWLGIVPSKYYDWQSRYGKTNEHNALIPRDFWLEDWEKKAIIDFYLEHPLEGYRRLSFMGIPGTPYLIPPNLEKDRGQSCQTGIEEVSKRGKGRRYH